MCNCKVCTRSREIRAKGDYTCEKCGKHIKFGEKRYITAQDDILSDKFALLCGYCEECAEELDYQNEVLYEFRKGN